MDIKIYKKTNNNLNKNELNITIEYNIKNSDYYELEQLLLQYKKKEDIFIVKNNRNELVYINKKNIIKVYSNNKINYCKTNDDNEYVINKKLYEIEDTYSDFIRISKKCIVNINQIKCFDMNYTRKNYS